MCVTVIWLQVYDEVRHPALIPTVPGKAASAATAGAKHGTEELLEVWGCSLLSWANTHVLLTLMTELPCTHSSCHIVNAQQNEVNTHIHGISAV